MTPTQRKWLLVPISSWAFVFILVPMLIVLAFSFSTKGEHGEILWNFTLDNYRNVFQWKYLKVAWLSLELAVFNTLLCLAVGYPLAYFMAKIKNPATRNILLILVLIPFWTNFLIRTYALGNILGDEGMINQFLLWIGIIHEPLDLIYSKKAILIGLLSNYLPFMVLPLYVSLEKVDRNLLEAATDLGATPLRAFARVTWPLSIPGVAAGSLIVFIPSLGEFIVPDLLGGGRYLLLGNLLQQKFLVLRDWPLGSALSMVVAFALLGLLLGFYFWRDQDESAF